MSPILQMMGTLQVSKWRSRIARFPNNCMNLALLPAIMNVKPWAHSRYSAGPRGLSPLPSCSQAVSRLTVWQKVDLVLEEPRVGLQRRRQMGPGRT